jgi:hypothetical protein
VDPPRVLDTLESLYWSMFPRALQMKVADKNYAMVYYRMYNRLGKSAHLQHLARIQLFSAVAFVLLFDVLAFSFIVGGYKPYVGVKLQATGSFAAHLFLSTLPLWLVSRGLSLREMISTKSTWGVLCCSCATLAAAIASLGLLGLSDVYQKLLVGARSALSDFDPS